MGEPQLVTREHPFSAQMMSEIREYSIELGLPYARDVHDTPPRLLAWSPLLRSWHEDIHVRSLFAGIQGYSIHASENRTAHHSTTSRILRDFGHAAVVKHMRYLVSAGYMRQEPIHHTFITRLSCHYPRTTSALADYDQRALDMYNLDLNLNEYDPVPSVSRIRDIYTWESWHQVHVRHQVQLWGADRIQGELFSPYCELLRRSVALYIASQGLGSERVNAWLFR